MRFPIILLSILSAAPHAGAAETPDGRDEALPCRPTIACTADLVAPGSFELEAGVLYRRLGGATDQWTTPFLAKQTLTDWLQLQLGSNGYTLARSDFATRYFDDVIVGPKVHLVDQREWRPSLSVSVEASVPTVRREGYLRTYDALTTAYLTKNVGPVQADLNLGANVMRLEESPLVQRWAALALSADVVEPFGVMAEGYVFSSAAPVAPRDGGLLVALSHSPRPWLVFDFGGDVGFYPSSRAYSVFIGATVVPVVFWREGKEGK